MIDRPLLVLNASAGSGKTYHLVRNYLRLLLDTTEDKAELGQLLAMTFTNKASVEMKTRIMRDLNNLGNLHAIDHPFLLEMSEILQQEPLIVKENARKVLRKLLHRYEDFNVMTIDKFNLKLIRSFTRDLDLPEQFEVVLDESLLLEKAVDELLNKIEKDEQSPLHRLAINFAKSNLNDDTKWDIKKSILETASLLKEERCFDVINQLTETDIKEENYTIWKSQLSHYQLTLSKLQSDLRSHFERVGIPVESFSGKSTTYNKITKLLDLPNSIKDIFELMILTPAFLGHLEKTKVISGETAFFTQFENYLNYWDTHKLEIFELDLKVRQFYLLGILRELAIHMNSMREQSAIIRISEFNKLVADLVKHEEAPYIYERLGTRYRHFFLDEFQDTSRLQWMNLLPLFHESLSGNYFNFIVGDPKQSIYRFKNGVAEQFVALPAIYNPEKDPIIAQKSEYFQVMGTVDRLKENWRSAKEIVNFNNRFFEALKPELSIEGQAYYSDITQDPKGKDNGYIEYLDLGDEKDTSVFSDKLLFWVEDCMNDGYEPGDICLLGRTKSDCNKYANTLKENGYSVISSDSLFVDSDQEVQFIISFCKWRNQPFSRQLTMRFAEFYFRLFHPEESSKLYLSCFEVINERSIFSSELFFSISGVNPEIIQIGYQDLYSLVQKVIRNFNIDETKNPYVHQLLDIAAQFDINQGPDLSNFLNYYDQAGKKTNVQLPDNSKSIKVMTAHKSKGLEFPIVIVPSLAFATKGNSKTDIYQSGADFIHFKFEGHYKNHTQMSKLIDAEKLADEMDAVNLLYVTFTRPVDRLYLINSFNRNNSGFYKKVKTAMDFAFSNHFVDGNKIIIGSKPTISSHEKSITNSFFPSTATDFLWYPKISLLSADDLYKSDLRNQQRFGIQFHSIMEKSHDLKSALHSIEVGIAKGSIDKLIQQELEEEVKYIYSNSDYKELISNGEQLGERTLLFDKNIRLRPDKLIISPEKTIVIDFKTGNIESKHTTQITQYIDALKSLGYEKVEGYLYYVSSRELQKIVSLF